MPKPENDSKDLDKGKMKASFRTRLAVFDAIANPILGIGKNLFESSKAVFDAVLGKLTYGLETLSDSLSKLSTHSTNMGIASAALNGIETLLLSPLSFYLRYKNKQEKQESLSWHTKAKFVYGIVVFAATIFAMAFPPAAIAVNIVLAASGVVAAGISIGRNIKRRLAAAKDETLQNTNMQAGSQDEPSGHKSLLKNEKAAKVPDNSKIAHKVFNGLLAIGALVAVGLAASGVGFLVAAGIVGAVVAVLSTVQLAVKIGEAIYKARSDSTPIDVRPANVPEAERVNEKHVVPTQTTEISAAKDSVKPTLSNDQQSSANEVLEENITKVTQSKSPLAQKAVKEALRDIKKPESPLGAGMSSLGRVRF